MNMNSTNTMRAAAMLLATSVTAVGTYGCSTVEKVAQGIADQARAGQKSDSPPAASSGQGLQQPAQSQGATPNAQASPQVAAPAAAAPTPAVAAAPAAPAGPPCEANFVVEGSFASGKQIKTHSPLPGVSADAAYGRAYRAVAKRGFQIVRADKAERIVSAKQNINNSRSGKTAPLNVMIETEGRESSVYFTFSIPSGTAAPEDTIRADYCKMTEEVLGRKWTAADTSKYSLTTNDSAAGAAVKSAAPANAPAAPVAQSSAQQPTAQSQSEAATPAREGEVAGRNGWTGKIVGVAPKGSPFARLEIGMGMNEAMHHAGPPTDRSANVTGKAFIPFNFAGSGKTEQVLYYKGRGRLLFAQGSGYTTDYFLVEITNNSAETGFK